jgi:hypothetical protein
VEPGGDLSRGRGRRPCCPGDVDGLVLGFPVSARSSASVLRCGGRRRQG